MMGTNGEEQKTDSSDIVNLGVLGRFYSARMVLGFYRTTCALTVLSFPITGLPNTDSWFKEKFYRALHHTINAHPSLCYGIIDETPEREAHFLRLPEIQRDDVAEFYGQDPDDPDDGDLAIAKLLQRSHARRLLEGHRYPAWRAVVLKHGNRWDSGKNTAIQRISIAFLANHAIADGLSHISFHRSLLHFFNQPLAEEYAWPLKVPRNLRCPILLEDVVDLLSRDENDKVDIDYMSPTVWSGENMFLNSVEDYESGLRFITVHQDHIGKLLNFCRSNKITLTGLLHGLLVTFLARSVSSGSSFLAVTPYSMRHISKVSEEEICNHAGGMVHEFPQNLATDLRNSKENSIEELELIVKTSGIFHKYMAAELARSPKNNVWAGMFGVTDWYTQSRGQLGKKRALTYELSNFGNLKVLDSKGLEGPLKLEKMLVSQCGSVTGPVFGCNSISIAGGPMTITFTWQKGSMKEKLIEDMAAYVDRRMEEGFDAIPLVA
ncbi:uncharacterized protein PAC_20129 [Phialocephala subalpina]|uniref:Alcohol acetyltransferase n=1 Tax=Phialocephala subalpina TaxID=576137 RepID=A0A1L7XYX0_9HELO|nr:uncharacterized protein PAC_20129 [Phialocephala subalpina]